MSDDYLETIYIETSDFLMYLDEDEVEEEMDEAPVYYTRRNVARQNKQFELNNERLKIWLAYTRYLFPGYAYTTKDTENFTDPKTYMDKSVYQAMNRMSIALMGQIERIANKDLIYE